MWSASPEGHGCTEEGEGGSCEQSQHSVRKEEGPIVGCIDYTGVHNCTLLLLNLPHALLCIAVNGNTICELRNRANKTSPSPSSHTCIELLCPASSTHYIARESAHFSPVQSYFRLSTLPGLLQQHLNWSLCFCHILPNKHLHWKLIFQKMKPDSVVLLCKGLH